jgi:hypothetical protein
MSEQQTASSSAVDAARLQAIRELRRQQDVVTVQLRQHFVGLGEDLGFGFRKFVADELALALAESCGTTQRWVEQSELFCAHPVVMARVADGSWSVRHADAVLGEIVAYPTEMQEQVIDAVLACGARTPYQLRKAAQAVVYLLDPEAAEKRARKAHDERGIGASTDAKGGATLFAWANKADVAMLLAAIDVHAEVAAPGDPRSLGQRRLDVLKDLVCGRLLPGQWQAVVLVEESTLTGASDAPAEIPGLGLITAGEARELLAHAELRRAVVDADGHLVSVDSQVARPDAPVEAAAEQAADGWAADDEVAADVLADGSAADRGVDVAADDTDDLGLDEVLVGTDLTEEIQAYDDEIRGLEPDAFSQALLRRVLDYVHAHTANPAAAHITMDDEGVFHVELPEDPHHPNGGIGPPIEPVSPLPGPHGAAVARRTRHRPWQERSQQPVPDPASVDDTWWEPSPPSQADLDHVEETVDHEDAHARIAELFHQAVPCPPRAWGPAPPPPPPRGWSVEGLTRAVGRLRRPAEPVPPPSKAYVFPRRAKRHIKLRDQHCTFPGCYRLAKGCDNDHVAEWPTGETSVHNGACECEHHHQYKHHGATSVRRLPDGTMRWTSRTGHVADTPPRRLIRGW